MYATAQYSVHNIRKDIQDVLCFAVLNVSSSRGHGQALECLVVGTWSIKSNAGNIQLYRLVHAFTCARILP